MQRFVSYKNIEIAYSDTGSGSAIVFLHGFLENSFMWKEISDTLVKKHRIITVDLLGHGATASIGYIHTMEEMAAAVFAVIRHLKLRRIKLVGHSMGGYVALAFAEKYSKFVKSLCLLNATARADSDERKLNRNRVPSKQ